MYSNQGLFGRRGYFAASFSVAILCSDNLAPNLGKIVAVLKSTTSSSRTSFVPASQITLPYGKFSSTVRYTFVAMYKVPMPGFLSHLLRRDAERYAKGFSSTA